MEDGIGKREYNTIFLQYLLVFLSHIPIFALSLLQAADSSPRTITTLMNPSRGTRWRTKIQPQN